MLAELSQRLLQIYSDELDIVARIGDDSSAAALPHAAGCGGHPAWAVAAVVDGQVTRALGAVDTALYDAKAAGRNCFKHAVPSQSAEAIV